MDNLRSFGDQVVPDIQSYEPRQHCERLLAGNEEFVFPEDPRTWSRDDVRQWLCCMKLNNALEVDVNVLPMNGKGLCLIHLVTFRKHIPLGGEVLYKDLRRRLRRF